jgi:hypothetical protein
MDENVDAAGDTSEQQEIAAAIQTVLAAHPAPAGLTAAQAQVEAQGIYHVWRNSFLNALPPDAYRLVETSSSALVAAIAAKLTTVT